MRKTTFKGANVFMSRNLVAPEIFDSLHDVLKDNGAEIFLCCDPSRNGPNDYHIIFSIDHEKFDDLRQKGCNLLGPQCVFSCAKEHRVLPKQGFTCCLAMDGVKILASGFEMKEKDEIGKLVTAMGGVLQTKASSDVSFVIVKNVLAAKYKWALNNLKKPIVSESWLHQCWKEHRVVSHESYRTLPFSGLTISVTQVSLDERKEIEKLVQQNGGKYSGDLTKKSTHLVCDISLIIIVTLHIHTPDGDKYKVAKRWGHIHIVTRAWFNQSITRRACLNEELYPVQKTSVTSTTSQRTSSKVVRNSECEPYQEISCDGMVDADLETTLSQNMASTVSDIPAHVSDDSKPPAVQHKASINIDACVAEDSQSEDYDLYLLDCKIHLVGFDASEMRRLVNMVRRGSGSRYMSLNEQLTHIVVGTPSESEKKEVRSLSAMGVINVVKTLWLEDCEREKKEVPVHRRHVAYDLLLPKDSVSYNKGSVSGMPGLKQGNYSSTIQPAFSNDVSQSLSEDQQKRQHAVSNKSQDKKSSVFVGRLFRFSSTFPDIQRGEIVDWIHKGGGEVADSRTEINANYIVEAHGVLCSPTQFTSVTNVSSHWIRSCLQDDRLLDVNSHTLFSPLQCEIPLPGFTGIRLCVSQYEEKDKKLLKNLCRVLGGKVYDNLCRKVKYLVCKFTEGPKYEAACQFGLETVTIEWIWECIKQNKVVATSQFQPKEATMSDREAGMCTTSQYPTQAFRMISSTSDSQLTGQPKEPITNVACIDDSISTKRVKYSNVSKNPRLSQDGSIKGSLSLASIPTNPICKNIVTKDGSVKGPLSSVSITTNPVCKNMITEDGSIKGPLSSVSIPTNPVRKNMVTEDGSNRGPPSSVSITTNPVCKNMVTEYGSIKGPLSSASIPTPICKNMVTDNMVIENGGEVSKLVPDVASAIEDLLEQTSKIHDQMSPDRTTNDKNVSEQVFTSDCSRLGLDPHGEDPHSAFGLSKHWTRRSNEKDDISNPGEEENAGIYGGGFSETQTESQVVGYEEDLSGRQMIIDRVRTRSGLTPQPDILVNR
ncbi:uncharacterized protein LOC143587514 [Bidens hawaiensis]|uniref:uncharacterized protein LOC143587514 n=1 Tax=Bidens hawaiensis TaxID=980011 RepID=UPI0040496B15